MLIKGANGLTSPFYQDSKLVLQAKRESLQSPSVSFANTDFVRLGINQNSKLVLLVKWEFPQFPLISFTKTDFSDFVRLGISQNSKLVQFSRLGGGESGQLLNVN